MEYVPEMSVNDSASNYKLSGPIGTTRKMVCYISVKSS